jgi:hypothetical protein
MRTRQRTGGMSNLGQQAAIMVDDSRGASEETNNSIWYAHALPNLSVHKDTLLGNDQDTAIASPRHMLHRRLAEYRTTWVYHLLGIY